MKIDIDMELLPFVSKPITYCGNEINAEYKDLKAVEIRFAFAFPDIYEVGMSHLGTRILYGLLNSQEDIYCERVFSPWVDMEEKLRECGLPLFSLETRSPLNAFDFIGFTLQYEMSYTNILNILELGHIPLKSIDRGESAPFIIAGGPCAYNPEPLSDFIDFFVIGEGEEVVLEIMSLYREWKQRKEGRIEFLKKVAGIEGVYVPNFYEVTYEPNSGIIKNFEVINENAPLRIKKRFVEDLETAYFPEKMIVPYTEIVHDRVNLEIFRGCGRGCRFCQAGMIYRPTREKTPTNIIEKIDKLLKTTGYDEVSLTSLSSGDYSKIEELIYSLMDKNSQEYISISLPSLRIDSLSIEILDEIQKVRKTGLTFAPEAGTQKMRDVINKGVTEKNLIDTVQFAFEKGWGHIKLYFMIGLPGESLEDIKGIADLGQKTVDAYFRTSRELRNKSLKVVLSTSSFVPKPFTPFQWMGQNTKDDFLAKQKYLKSQIKDKKISYSWHDSGVSFLEAVFARGDRRLGKVLEIAHKKGCRFDGWNEHFSYEKWMESFEEAEINPDFYATRERDYSEILPWDFIDPGVKKSFLINENEKSKEEILTPYCKEKCSNCGILEFSEGWQCHEKN
ncbi:MAG: TIGR03960 family B12-binding radical SAM protein [Eubacteriaceae bacterium]